MNKFSPWREPTTNKLTPLTTRWSVLDSQNYKLCCSKISKISILSFSSKEWTFSKLTASLSQFGSVILGSDTDESIAEIIITNFNSEKKNSKILNSSEKVPETFSEKNQNFLGVKVFNNKLRFKMKFSILNPRTATHINFTFSSEHFIYWFIEFNWLKKHKTDEITKTRTEVKLERIFTEQPVWETVNKSRFDKKERKSKSKKKTFCLYIC